MDGWMDMRLTKHDEYASGEAVGSAEQGVVLGEILVSKRHYPAPNVQRSQQQLEDNFDIA